MPSKQATQASPKTAKKGRSFPATAPTASLRKKVANMSKARKGLTVVESVKRSGGVNTLRIEASGPSAEGFAANLAAKVANMSAAWKHIVFGVTSTPEDDGVAIEVTITPAYKLKQEE